MAKGCTGGERGSPKLGRRQSLGGPVSWEKSPASWKHPWELAGSQMLSVPQGRDASLLTLVKAEAQDTGEERCVEKSILMPDNNSKVEPKETRNHSWSTSSFPGTPQPVNWDHHFHFKGEKTKRQLAQGLTDPDSNPTPLISFLNLHFPWLPIISKSWN